jgi:hypothetical protein
MMTPEEWRVLLQKTFRAKPVQAPPFLWTRIQAQIEAEETQRATWWFQWRWMTGFTLTASVAVGLISFLALKPAPDLPLESLLEGQPHPHAAIQIASTRWINADHTAGFILEDQPWVDD